MGLRCAGDFDARKSQLSVRAERPDARDDSVKEVYWKGVMFPQIPNYLFITYEKDPEFMQYENPLVGIDRVDDVAAHDSGYVELVTISRIPVIQILMLPLSML